LDGYKNWEEDIHYQAGGDHYQAGGELPD